MISIRPFEEKDASALTEMMVEMTQFYGATISPAMNREAQILDQTKNMEVLLAFHENKLAGFTTFKVLFPVAGLLSFIHVQQIYVGSSARRLGVARQLMIGIAKAARNRGCKWIEWATSASNTDARAFYDTLGGSSSPKIHYILKDEALAQLASI